MAERNLSERLLAKIGPGGPGAIALSEKEISVTLETSLEGSLAALGKAPRLNAARINASVYRALKGDSFGVQCNVDANSLAVVSPEIAAADHARILTEVHGRLLETGRYPVISFQGKLPIPHHAHGWNEFPFQGRLTLKGSSREIELSVRRDSVPRAEGAVFSCEYVLSQRLFGMEPLGALAGQLRCKDEVVVQIRICLDRILA